MKFREVLQIEIWSKDTSRKILKRTWKFLKYAGLGVVATFAGILLFAFVWTHWLTTKERSAGKIALAQIDGLQNLKSASDAEFDLQVKRAQENVDAADAAAMTGKDKNVANFLSIYLYLQTSDRKVSKVIQKARQNSTPGSAREEYYERLELKSEESDRLILGQVRGPLHEWLDK